MDAVLESQYRGVVENAAKLAAEPAPTPTRMQLIHSSRCAGESAHTNKLLAAVEISNALGLLLKYWSKGVGTQ